MAVDPRLGEINTAEFTREFEAEIKKIAEREAQQRAAKPKSPAVHYLFRQLGPNGGITAAAASVLAHVIVDLQERIAAFGSRTAQGGPAMKRIYTAKTTQQLHEAGSTLFAGLLRLSKHDPAFTGVLMARINTFTDCIFAVAETSVREDVRSAARKAKKRGRK